jgi:hypothetical protein
MGDGVLIYFGYPQAHEDDAERAVYCPRRFARLRSSAARVRIRSRSTSAKPPSTASISRPVLAPVSARGSKSERNCAFASTIRLTMATLKLPENP